jgi:hypothetical protein
MSGVLYFSGMGDLGMNSAKFAGLSGILAHIGHVCIPDG